MRIDSCTSYEVPFVKGDIRPARTGVAMPAKAPLLTPKKDGLVRPEVTK